jgi:hypothetical protein
MCPAVSGHVKIETRSNPARKRSGEKLWLQHHSKNTQKSLPWQGEVPRHQPRRRGTISNPSPAGDSKWCCATVAPQIPQDSARYPLTGIALFAVKKGQKPPAIPRCWTHGQRNVRVPLESSGRSVALRISLRLQGRTCEAILRVSPARRNAPTRCALDF